MVKLTLKPTEDPKFHLQPCERGKRKRERLEEATYKELTAVIHNPPSQRGTSLRKTGKARKRFTKEAGTAGRCGNPLACSWFEK